MLMNSSLMPVILVLSSDWNPNTIYNWEAESCRSKIKNVMIIKRL